MKITFNQVGIIVSTELDDTYRQGSVGNKLTAKFIDKLNTNYIAKINITRPDGSILDNLLMTPSSQNSDEFEYTFNDEWYLAIPGTATLTIYLFDANQNVQAQGQVSFNIESSDYTDDPTYPTEPQYNDLLSQVISKLGKSNKNWVRASDDFVEKATSGLLPKLEYVKDAYVFVHDDENEQSLIYQITAVSDNPNNENYVFATYRLLLTFADGLWTLEQIIARVEEVCYTKPQVDNFLSEKANTVYVDTNFGNSIEMRVDSDYKIYLSLINKNGQQIGETQVIDLPLESVVVSGYYDSDTKEVVLALKDGSTIRFSVADLVSGLQTEITPANKLSADLVDDDNTTHKFVTAADKTNWNGKQDALVSGTNIKTINNESILGSGNIDIQGGTYYQEGFGIDIANDTISVDTDVITTKEEFNALKLLVEESIVDTTDYQFNYWDIDNVPITINSYPTLVSAGLDIKALRGRSVAFNQIVRNGNFADDSGWYTANTGTISVNNNKLTFTKTVSGVIAIYRANSDYPTFVANHKYLIKSFVTTSAGCKLLFNCGNVSSPLTTLNANQKTFVGGVITPTATSGFVLKLTDSQTLLSENDTLILEDVQLFDLTLMGLDSITSVEEFNKLFPQPYYSYDAGTLLSSKASALDVVGYNQFDGVLTNGYINGTTGAISPDNLCRTSTNFIKVIPGQTYKLEVDKTTSERYVGEYDKNQNFIKNTYASSPFQVTLGANTHYVRIEYKTNPFDETAKAIFHLTSTGAKIISDVYGKQTYPLPNIELKGAGTAYDELKPDGTLTTRIGVVDLGTLDWVYFGGYFVCERDIGNARPSSASVAFNGLCAKYTVVPQSKSLDKTIKAVPSSGHLIVHDSSYTDATTFKTAMSGVYLYFEVATPTETQTEYTYIDSIESLQDGATLSQTSSVGFGYIIDTEMAIYKPKGE